METVRTVAALREQVTAWRQAGARVALTPTMGALHEAHLSLVALARSRADKVVASIFVNPTQFGPGEDFESYPRDEARDAAMLAGAGCDLLFAPSLAEMYPDGFSTEVRVRGLTDVLCGAARPRHFDGVAQVVSKLLIQAMADIAIFGEKDWQQLAVIRRLARDLDIPTEILGAPVIREADGLAMSSRNRYLTAAERGVASELSTALRRVGERTRNGVLVEEAAAEATARLLGTGFSRVDYIEVRDGASLEAMESVAGRQAARVFGAAVLGRARLIDNLAVWPADGPGSDGGRGA
ncbi:MAG: pantoate--beta-alanine ligase [Pseudomonadota bacterium]